ncbi:MAG: flippase-like domain-containing protein [Elusimicrobiota bacterium]|nr:MAG: flippase-like domain-containing protein [Elusimicrobiota bacterium]
MLGSSSGLLGGLAKRALRRWPQAGKLASLLGPVVAMDGCLSDFYRLHKSRFLLSTLWHLAGMILGAVELLVIARFLGLSLDVRGALIMEAVATLAAASSFMIPGSLGAFEFGHYMAASMLGLPPAAGVLISLVRRSRELFWLLAGVFLLHRLRPAAAALREKEAGDKTVTARAP